MLKFTYKAFKKTFLSKYTLVGIILTGVFIAGLFANSKVFAPDLKRLYMESEMVSDQPPVIFIHGVLGSKLKDIKTQEDLGLARLAAYCYMIMLISLTILIKTL